MATRSVLHPEYTREFLREMARDVKLAEGAGTSPDGYPYWVITSLFSAENSWTFAAATRMEAEDHQVKVWIQELNERDPTISTGQGVRPGGAGTCSPAKGQHVIPGGACGGGSEENSERVTEPTKNINGKRSAGATAAAADEGHDDDAVEVVAQGGAYLAVAGRATIVGQFYCWHSGLPAYMHPRKGALSPRTTPLWPEQQPQKLKKKGRGGGHGWTTRKKRKVLDEVLFKRY